MPERMSYDPNAKESKIHKPKQEKGPASTGENEMTPYRAHNIFTNEMINIINKELKPAKQITSADGEVSLKWFVDETTPDGHFAIVQRNLQKKSTEENKSYVLEKDTETGETYQVEKMSGPVKLQDEKDTVYDLNTNQVRKIFDNLEPVVKESFISGLEESLAENVALVEKFNKALEGEKRDSIKEELKMKITEHELAQDKLKKEIKALT